jgi:hypothetical protein
MRFWLSRKSKSPDSIRVEADFLQGIEEEFLLQNVEMTRAAAELLHRSHLLEAEFDEERGSLRIVCENGSVVVATPRGAAAGHVVAMVALEPVTLSAFEVNNKISVVARSTSWSYRVVGSVAACEPR